MFVKRYLIPRLLQYFLVIFLGITIVFFIPRFAPTNPVQRTIAELRSRGTYLNPADVEQMVEDLTRLYGLEGSWFDQYIDFWKRLFSGDFGISFFQFPVPVIDLIKTALPWTVGLLFVTTVLSWVIGNIIGGMAGYFNNKLWSRILDGVVMFIRPMPYYIFALGLLILLSYVFRLFPIAGGATIGRTPSFTLSYILDVLRHAFLPALSLVILGAASWFQASKLIVQNVNAEDFVQYAQLGGIKERKIMFKYVIRNAMLPQVTNLALSLGQILSGALITEIVFSYPGLGNLLFSAISTGDYNLIMGITALSIVAITTLVLIIDLIYPLFDPRIKYK
ncbi:MAG TPA: ABC transporter permease [Halanaerobiaceae bacterium]|jgi:peptide/nickel transport system permease protein|nr:ABC transporter permease [Bacillota bacterium]HHU92485.1 ABC transporter permease [Halanaerobiaceae bacterium]HOA41596.1 ABC transporter permease [Halanaerobiales bacterium]HPZ63595.1 ABC transporter permease [Halanaerobiales bacterium]HQD04571.1 ABC transporter permease [Halanaerobiales bacterium]